MSKTLIEVLQENNIRLTRRGDKWSANCPFHEGDSTPSFFVYPSDTYFCFGCSAWGDAVKFLVEYGNYNTQQAREYVGIEYKQEKPKEIVKVKNTLKSYALIARAALEYHTYLLELQGPKNYVLNRGLTEETISKYKIGYTDGAVLNLSNLDDFAVGVEAGLITKDGWEILSHRITIPNFVDSHTADFMSGRTVIKDPIKYVGLRVPKPLAGFFEVRHSPIIFIVEGQFDHLILRQWEYPAVLMSGNRISKPNLALLKDKFVVVVPDNDAEGQKGAESLKNSLGAVEILKWDDHGQKDISGLVGAGYGREEFDNAVKEALWKRSELQTTWSKFLPRLVTQNLLPWT